MWSPTNSDRQQIHSFIAATLLFTLYYSVRSISVSQNAIKRLGSSIASTSTRERQLVDNGISSSTSAVVGETAGVETEVMQGGDKKEEVRQLSYVFDPKTIDTHHVPTMYPFIDISSISNSNGGDPKFATSSIRDDLLWYDELYSNSMDSCIDFQCTSDVEKCNNVHLTNYDNSNGEPPCCTHILRDMLHTFDTEMSNIGINYFVGFGTLLGLIRNELVIPWTIDNDIVIENVQTLFVMSKLWNAQSTGLQLIYPKMGKRLRGFPRMCITSNFANGKLNKWKIPTPVRHNGEVRPFSSRGFPYLDIYFGKDQHDVELFGGEYMGCKHYQTDVYPTQRRYVYQGQFALNFPQKPEALLERYYGLDWRVPKTDNSQHGDFHQICAVNYGLEDLS